MVRGGEEHDGEPHRRLGEARGMRRGLGSGPSVAVWGSLQNLQGGYTKIEACFEFSLLRVRIKFTIGVVDEIYSNVPTVQR